MKKRFAIFTLALAFLLIGCTESETLIGKVRIWPRDITMREKYIDETKVGSTVTNKSICDYEMTYVDSMNYGSYSEDNYRCDGMARCSYIGSVMNSYTIIQFPKNHVKRSDRITLEEALVLVNEEFKDFIREKEFVLDERRSTTNGNRHIFIFFRYIDSFIVDFMIVETDLCGNIVRFSYWDTPLKSLDMFDIPDDIDNVLIEKGKEQIAAQLNSASQEIVELKNFKAINKLITYCSGYKSYVIQYSLTFTIDYAGDIPDSDSLSTLFYFLAPPVE